MHGFGLGLLRANVNCSDFGMKLAILLPKISRSYLDGYRGSRKFMRSELRRPMPVRLSLTDFELSANTSATDSDKPVPRSGGFSP